MRKKALDLPGGRATPHDLRRTAATRMAVYGGAALDYSQVVLTCPAGVIDNDCHKLNGLKGTSTSPLETEVFDWIQNL